MRCLCKIKWLSKCVRRMCARGVAKPLLPARVSVHQSDLTENLANWAAPASRGETVGAGSKEWVPRQALEPLGGSDKGCGLSELDELGC